MSSFKIKDLFYIILRLRKLLFFRDLLYIPINNLPLKKYGNEGASWYINPCISNNSIVYSFGIGCDISFDLGLIKDFGVKVYAFDPTPKSAEWLRNQQLPSQFIYTPVGLSAQDGTLQFFLPSNPNYVSASIVSAQNPESFFDAPVKKLKSIADNFGHSKIDILKMDIEGAEYEVIDDILKSNIEIKQILIEFHHRYKEIGKAKTKDAVNKLKKHGYQIIHVSQNTGEEFTFFKK